MFNFESGTILSYRLLAPIQICVHVVDGGGAVSEFCKLRRSAVRTERKLVGSGSGGRIDTYI